MKIFISHSARDLHLVIALKSKMQDTGHEIIVAAEDIKPGQDWTSEIKLLLEQADILMPFVTSNTSSSAWAMYELGVFSEYVRQNKDNKFIIPVVFDSAKVPTPLQNFQYVAATSNDLDFAIASILQAVSHVEGRKIAKEQDAKEVKRNVEISAADYVGGTIETLQIRESRFNKIAVIWQFLGFASLLAGAILVGCLAINGFGKNGSWLDIALLGSKLITIIVLLLSLSKYSFNISKTYMHESLKNADRFHAISFGKFYLQVFSSTITKEDIKEVFTDWNLEKSSKFSELSSNDYDPKLIGLVEKALDTIKEKK